MASALSRRAAKTIQTRLYSASAKAEPISEKRAYLPPQPPKVTKLPNGITVASIENYSPVARIAMVANAGSRFEDGDNLGVTHCLRIAAGLSNRKSSGFNLVRSVEQAGANFTCSSSREYMFYRFDVLRNDLDLAIDIVSQAMTSPGIRPWELSEAQGQLNVELAALTQQPNARLYDMLHQAAFRDTLGRSLYAPEFMVGKYNSEQLVYYMQKLYSAGRLAVVGVGVDHNELVKRAKYITPFSEADVPKEKSQYHGGEIRCNTGGELSYAAVAVQGPSLAGKDLLHAGVLQNIMGMGPYVKYSSGAAGSRLVQAASSNAVMPFAVSCFNANYTDNGLFGFYAIAQPREIEKVLRSSFSQFAEITKSGVKDEDVKRAKEQLKSQISMYRESTEAQMYDLAEQALGSEDLLSTSDLIKLVEAITTADVNTVAKKLVNGKPSMAAIGNLSRTPYVDSLLQ